MKIKFRDLINGYILNNTRLKDSIFINFMYFFYSFIRYYVSSGFRFYRIGRLSVKKTSDTLVVLGAGCTVNELSQTQVDELERYDVAGLSYSCVLPIKQRFYFYECPSYNNTEFIKEHVTKVIPAINRAGEEGKLENLIWKNSQNKILNEFTNMKKYLSPKVSSILTDNPNVISKLLKCYMKSGINNLFLIQKRGSVAALVQFGLLLKYKKIIFVGIDLNSRKYFFEDDAKYNEYGFTNPYLFDSSYNKDIHRTNDASSGIPIIDVLKIMFKSSESTTFYVSSRNSALACCLPLWEWKRS
ncbi:hypothetical protein N8135_03575 [Oceanospirillaceae bacterium]|nr:hypothetical protein [Oceanospirillaceae bacterium]